METVFGLPKASMLRPLLFSVYIYIYIYICIYLADLFFNISHIDIPHIKTNRGLTEVNRVN